MQDVTTALQLLHQVLDRFQEKDIDGVVALFADDGLLFDPHYPPPIGPAMAGGAAIREGLSWGLGMLEQPGFAVRHEMTSAAGGGVAAVEVDTNHRLVGGVTLAFPQLFVAEADDDDLLRRLQSYTPYPPPTP